MVRRRWMCLDDSLVFVETRRSWAEDPLGTPATTDNMREAHELYGLLLSVQRRTRDRCFAHARPDGHACGIVPGDRVHRGVQL